MNRLLIAAIFALTFCAASPAQQRFPSPTYGVEHPPAHTMDELVAARAKLIARYVKADHYAWGVAVCGEDDYFTGEDSSWLTVYLYKDSLMDFAADFDKWATHTKNGTLTVDGITVVVEVIERPKTKGGASNEQPNIGTGKRQDRGSSVPTFHRAA